MHSLYVFLKNNYILYNINTYYYKFKFTYDRVGLIFPLKQMFIYV